MKAQSRNLLITTVICAGINIGTILYECTNLSFQENALRIISDGFFISGIFIFLIGLLTYVSNEGGLYFMDYLGHRLKYSITRRGKPMHYYEFVDLKRESGKLAISHLFFVSILSILISLIIAFFC